MRPAVEAAVGDSGTVRQHSDYRDFSVLEVAVPTATTGALGLVFDLLKEHLKGKLAGKRAKPGRAILIRVGEVVVTVDPAWSHPEIDAAITLHVGDAALDDAGDVRRGDGLDDCRQILAARTAREAEFSLKVPNTIC